MKKIGDVSSFVLSNDEGLGLKVKYLFSFQLASICSCFQLIFLYTGL